MGELQLGQIIEDILTPAQYERGLSPFPNPVSAWNAIKLPGQGEEPAICRLTPNSTGRLLSSGRSMNQERKRKSSVTARLFLLVSNVFAKDIQQKYLFPPATTNFEFSFCQLKASIPEVVRNPEFFDRLRRDEQILVAGPSTLIRPS